MDVRDFIDLERYPIAAPGSGDCTRLVSSIQSRLALDGCAVLSGFIRADRIDALIAEADRVAPCGHRSFNRTNVYFTRDDPALPDQPSGTAVSRPVQFVRAGR